MTNKRSISKPLNGRRRREAAAAAGYISRESSNVSSSSGRGEETVTRKGGKREFRPEEGRLDTRVAQIREEET